MLGPGSAQRVERLHMRGALGNANRRRRSTLSAIPPCVSRRLACVCYVPAGDMTLVGCVGTRYCHHRMNSDTGTKDVSDEAMELLET